MSRQAIDLPQITVLIDRLRVEVVRREMIASVDDDPMEIPLFPGHAVQ
jgi:hypothetical protein